MLNFISSKAGAGKPESTHGGRSRNYGVERHRITFAGQAVTVARRRWPIARCAGRRYPRFHLAIRDIAMIHGGVCTVGSVKTKPGIVTAVVGEAEMTLDQRHLNADALAVMYREAKEASVPSPRRK